jgi:plastocyanin
MRALNPLVAAVILSFATSPAEHRLDAAPAVADIPPCASPQSCASNLQEISGVITVNRKLTKPSVTAAVPMYQRGATVALGKDAAEDPLALERSRVVVYIEGPLPPSPASTHHSAFRMEQTNRRFSPDVLVVPVGATVSFPNMDPIFHNIFSLSRPKEFDLGSYDQGDSRNVTFTKPGIVYVYCHLHPNMEGTIVIAPSEYFAQVDASGHFRLPAVPPGEYRIVAWHKAAGFFRKQIVVTPGHDVSADFLIPLPAEPKQSVHPQSDHAMAHMGGN